MEEKYLKEVTLKTLNNFETLDSVVCIVSNKDKSSAIVASKNREDLQNMLVSAMTSEPSVHKLFKGAVVAAELFKK